MTTAWEVLQAALASIGAWCVLGSAAKKIERTMARRSRAKVRAAMSGNQPTIPANPYPPRPVNPRPDESRSYRPASGPLTPAPWGAYVIGTPLSEAEVERFRREWAAANVVDCKQVQA